MKYPVVVDGGGERWEVQAMNAAFLLQSQASKKYVWVSQRTLRDLTPDAPSLLAALEAANTSARKNSQHKDLPSPLDNA